MHSFMKRLAYQLKTWQNFCNKFLNRTFVRHREINSSTQKSSRICMNWWNNFFFKRKRRNINDFTFITIDLDLEALKDNLTQINATAQWSWRTWVAGIDQSHSAIKKPRFLCEILKILTSLTQTEVNVFSRNLSHILYLKCLDASVWDFYSMLGCILIYLKHS